ncbi:hypothetical protein CSC94_12880 [Zhengella mangrovi]|uniref:Lectin-like protein BA14k n=1 Tax=Zhengella mangrovi TaxID=1982044 RepID=A0A2G1QM22_9HYPH|nr:BA14K family protein [Zhengella mangrovi]PHP66576.1 hypothetical protein CSC94_12880 [Zhengella mangrovi]
MKTLLRTILPAIAGVSCLAAIAAAPSAMALPAGGASVATHAVTSVRPSGPAVLPAQYIPPPPFGMQPTPPAWLVPQTPRMGRRAPVPPPSMAPRHDNRKPAMAGKRRPMKRSCDVRACKRAYRTFRASDCTFQPYRGPRRQCTK